MNPAIIFMIIRFSALSALVSAFMSYFLRMTIPGLTFISLGVMFLCYAILDFIAYGRDKKSRRIIGMAVYCVAGVVICGTGFLQIFG